MVPRRRSSVPVAASAANGTRAEAAIARPRIRFGLMSSPSEIVVRRCVGRFAERCPRRNLGMRVSCPLRADLKSDLSNLTKRREALDRAQGDAFGQEAVQFALDQRQLHALNLST